MSQITALSAPIRFSVKPKRRIWIGEDSGSCAAGLERSTPLPRGERGGGEGSRRAACTTFSYLLRPFLLGTLAPFLRASDRPMAIACLRLLTFLPEPPLFKVPCLRLCIARLTLDCAFLLYLRTIIVPL